MLRERVATATALIEKLESHRALVAWTSDTSFGELLVSVTSTRKIAADFQATLSKEKSIASEVKAASKRKVEIEKQLAGLAPRLERLREAQDVLQKILSQHSLSSAVDDSLKKNREAIEFIFGRIHAPAEFSGLGDDLKTLVRKNGDVPAGLHQISTGQRAAFALSLFLAQNMQLKNAPPVVLIDDPIAHVDDLNCLSFLDFLRELTITSERQLFFATADEKLATLFQRKFDFLGESDFRRFNLAR